MLEIVPIGWVHCNYRILAQKNWRGSQNDRILQNSEFTAPHRAVRRIHRRFRCGRRPARTDIQPGDIIILYGVGFGAVTPNIPAVLIVGEFNTLAAPFRFYFGNTEASLSYDGLVPLTFTLGGAQGAQTLYIAVE